MSHVFKQKIGIGWLCIFLLGACTKSGFKTQENLNLDNLAQSETSSTLSTTTTMAPTTTTTMAPTTTTTMAPTTTTTMAPTTTTTMAPTTTTTMAPTTTTTMAPTTTTTTTTSTTTTTLPEVTGGSTDFYPMSQSPSSGYSVRVSSPGKMNIYIDQSPFNPMLPAGSYIGVKSNGKINAGKISAGEPAPNLSLKFLNDSSQPIVVDQPSVSGGVKVTFPGTVFPLNVAAKSEVNFDISPTANIVGPQSSQIEFVLSNGTRFTITLQLNAK